MLRAEDLTANQSYLIAARRRHLLAGHIPGIVTGLEPSVQNGVVKVSPGVAIDGAGRELMVTEDTVPRPSGTPGMTADLGIYVQYSRVAPERMDPGHPRWSEQSDVFMAPLFTVTTPVSDVTALPDDTTAPAWPVLLGVVKAGNAGLDLTARAGAGAVGSAMSPPQGTSRIAFSRAGTVLVAAASEVAPALSVDASGCSLPGDAAVHGSLTVGSSVPPAQPTAPPLILQARPVPSAASPWALYRTRLPGTPPTATTPGAPAADELRIELPVPPVGPDPAQQAVSFGLDTGGKTFARKMSVLTDGTVVIMGNLHITGRLATAPAQVDASDPRLRQALLANFAHGVQAGTEVLREQYTGRLALTNLALATSGSQIACTLSLVNTSAVTVINITVTATVWLEGTAPDAPNQTLGTAIKLDEYGSLALHGNLKAPGMGTMNVLVSAVGSGAAGTMIEANDLTGSVKVRGGGAA